MSVFKQFYTILILNFCVSLADNSVIEEDSESREKLISDFEYVQYKYPVEIVPAFEAFYLKFETLYRNIMHAKCTGTIRNVNTNFEENILSQASSLVRDLRIIPSTYILLLEKPLTEGVSECRFHMNWFLQIVQHLRSFSKFSYSQFVRYREVETNECVQYVEVSSDVCKCTYF